MGGVVGLVGGEIHCFWMFLIEFLATNCQGPWRKKKTQPVEYTPEYVNSFNAYRSFCLDLINLRHQPQNAAIYVGLRTSSPRMSACLERAL